MAKKKKDVYRFEEIPLLRALAMLKHTDASRKNPVNASHAYALVKNNSTTVAIITYGSPPSPAICKGVCGEDEKDNVYEISSIWKSKNITPKQMSWFIKATSKKVGRDIIIGYVPTSEADKYAKTLVEAGYVYSGLTKKRTQRVDAEGNVVHNRSKDHDKSNTFIVPRPRKHRFVMFNVDGARKDELMDKCKYDLQVI